jgi:hypothetical protein
MYKISVLFISLRLKNREHIKGSLSMPAAIYVLFDIVVEFYTGSVVYVMKCMLVFYIYKTNYKKRRRF